MDELSILFVSYLSTRPHSNTSFSSIELKQKGFHRNVGLLVPSATLFKPVIHPMKAFFLSCKLPLEAKSQTRECWPKLSIEECLFCSWQLTIVTKCLCNSFVSWGLVAGPVILSAMDKDWEVQGSIPAPSYLLSREPAVLKFARWLCAQKKRSYSGLVHIFF